LFGFILAFAAKVFAVEVDERQAAIAEVLPGANCGGCGFAGCSAYAAAVAAGKAELNACAAGGSEVSKKIAKIMGTEAGILFAMLLLSSAQAGRILLNRSLTIPEYRTARLRCVWAADRARKNARMHVWVWATASRHVNSVQCTSKTA
jgi:Na+-translocating ferredoxin:NAD+ oxidoreductase RNF subunit RnfB